MSNKEEKEKWSIWETLLGILAIVLVVFFVWKFLSWIFNLGSRNRKGRSKNSYIETFLKQQENATNEKRENQNEVINLDHPDKGLKLVLILGRMLIVICLLTYNYVLYFKYNSDQFDLSKQLNYNEALLLSYSFICFILYGSVTKFVVAMKWMIKFALLWVKRII